jgi:hypothetical protein
MAKAHCGTFEACLSNPAFPAIKAGAANRKHLPERKVPGHNRQHHTEGLKANETLSCIGLDNFIREVTLGILSVVTTNPGAFFRFLHRGGKRLTHLERHQPGKIFLFAFQDFGGALHHRGAFAEFRAAMIEKRGEGAAHLLV